MSLESLVSPPCFPDRAHPPGKTGWRSEVFLKDENIHKCRPAHSPLGTLAISGFRSRFHDIQSRLTRAAAKGHQWKAREFRFLYVLKLSFCFFITCFVLYACVYTCVLCHVCGSQQATCRSRFFPLTTEVLGIELRSLGLTAGTFTHWATLLGLAKLLFYYLIFVCVCAHADQEPQDHPGCGSSRAAHSDFATFDVVLETGSFSHWSGANVNIDQ